MKAVTPKPCENLFEAYRTAKSQEEKKRIAVQVYRRYIIYFYSAREMAAYYGLTRKEAKAIIDEGRICHNMPEVKGGDQ